MQARFAILQVLLEKGEGLVSLDKTIGADGEPDLLVTLDRSKINSSGKVAIGDFLKKLQVCRCYTNRADWLHVTPHFTMYHHMSIFIFTHDSVLLSIIVVNG